MAHSWKGKRQQAKRKRNATSATAMPNNAAAQRLSRPAPPARGQAARIDALVAAAAAAPARGQAARIDALGALAAAEAAQRAKSALAAKQPQQRDWQN
jgi:hypothetical protein